jgi:hypothetical protein
MIQEANPYEYVAIGENQIRLMYLFPGLFTDELRCELKVVDTDKPYPYVALSYRWGSTQDVKLFCEDQYLLISNELSQALRRVRFESDVRVIWIDQVSINQKSETEQAAQVRRMGATYSEASEVLVWLGEEDEETAIVYDLIADVSQQIKELRQQPEKMRAFNDATIRDGTYYLPLNLASADSAEWVAFRNLNNRSWFTRTWTFQELALSQRASVICGSHSVPWERFLLVCEMVDAYDKARLPGHESHLKETYPYIQYLAMVRMHLSRVRLREEVIPGMDQLVDLLNLVMALRRNETSRPRDKIFGLWGCARDVQSDAVIQEFVDYSQPWEKIFSAFTKWFIMRYRDLSVFRLINVTGNPPKPKKPGLPPPDLPSWTPDFSLYDQWNSLRVDMSSKILHHGRNRLYNSTGSSTASATPDYERQLRLRGIHVGTITELTEPAGNLLGDVGIGPRVLTGGEWHLTVSEKASTDGIYLPTGEPIKLAYHRLRIGDYLWNELRAEDRRRRSKPLLNLPEPQPVGYSAAVGRVVSPRRDIGTLILKWTTRQRLYITDTGYMGLCHRSCKLGDQIFLLMGGDMPFILRKKDSGTFQFKGETYAHGIMDGEYLIQHYKAMADPNASMSDEQWLDSLDQDPLPFETQTVILD